MINSIRISEQLAYNICGRTVLYIHTKLWLTSTRNNTILLPDQLGLAFVLIIQRLPCF